MIHHFDNHNLGMRGIKHACGRTHDASSDSPVIIYYDTRFGIVGTYLKGARYTPMVDDKVIFIVCTTAKPMTMQEIADRIHEAWTARRS